MRERCTQILLESDSSSALQLFVGQDIPKRSRHVEIRMAWMKAKISSNELLVEHRAGTDNVADLFTKCRNQGFPQKPYELRIRDSRSARE